MKFLDFFDRIFLTLILPPVLMMAAFNTHGSIRIGFIFLTGLSILRTFTFVHEASHHTLFKGRHWNDGVGLMASLYCILPYFSWKFVHHEHHKWAGWRSIDPTEEKPFHDLPAPLRFIADVLWLLWIPILGCVFSLGTFWNFKKLARRFPGKQKRLAFGIGLLITVHLLFIKLAPEIYLHIYLPSYGVFMAFMDPIAVSQHSGMRLQKPPAAELPKPFAPIDQNRFTRTLIFPRWVSRNILFGFNLHSVHHAYPWRRGDTLDQILFSPLHSENGWHWLIQNKLRPLSKVMQED